MRALKREATRHQLAVPTLTEIIYEREMEKKVRHSKNFSIFKLIYERTSVIQENKSRDAKGFSLKGQRNWQIIQPIGNEKFV